MSDQVRIQIIFKENVNIKGQTLPYQDAFYFTQEEYNALTSEQLREMKDERIANWKNAVENPPAAVEPTPEQIQEQIDNLESQKASLVSQKAEVVAKLEAVALAEKLEG